MCRTLNLIVQQANLAAWFVTTWWRNVPGWQNVPHHRLFSSCDLSSHHWAGPDFSRKRCLLSARLRFQHSWYSATVFLHPAGFNTRNLFQWGFLDVLCTGPVMKSKPMLSFAISSCPMLHHSDTNYLVRSAMMDHTDCPKTPFCRLQKFQLYKLICPNQRGRLSVALFCILCHLHPGIWHWHNTWGVRSSRVSVLGLLPSWGLWCYTCDISNCDATHVTRQWHSPRRRRSSPSCSCSHSQWDRPSGRRTTPSCDPCDHHDHTPGRSWTDLQRTQNSFTHYSVKQGVDLVNMHSL